MRLALAFAAVLMLAGCGSSPTTHYYTLDVTPGAPQHARTDTTPVAITAVHIPPMLDRREMVAQTGPNAIDIRHEAQWSAPLGPMIRRVLSQDLAAKLPEGKVVMPDAPMAPRTARIVVTIVQFGARPDGKIALVAGWVLLKGDPPRPSLRREVTLEADRAGDDAKADAAAMSALLGSFAERIAGVLAGGK